MARRKKRRIHLKVRPGAAEVGATVKLKGRVTGGRGGKTKVTVFAGGTPLVTLKTKRSGAFKTSAVVPSDRTFKACAGKTCDKAKVKTPPDTINYAWTWQGYSFSTQVTGMSVVDVTTDTLNQKPGEAKITFGVTGDQLVTNTTPGRNASPDWTSLRAVYPASSTLCQATGTGADRTTAALDVELGTSQPGSPSPSTAPTPYCYFGDYLSGARGTGIETLGPGQTGYNAMEYTDGYGNAYSISFIVPESSLATVVADLTHPSFWILSRGLGGPVNDGAAGVCRAFTPVVATSKGGSTVCAQGVQ